MRKLLILILSFCATFSFAQNPKLERHWWVPDGAVDVVEFDTIKDVVYLGGAFENVGAKFKNNVFLDHETLPDPRFPEINGVVGITLPDGNGGWYISGGFSQVGDSIRDRIAHISSSREVSGKFSGIGLNGVINDMILSNDTLFVSGGFSASGEIRKNCAALDLNSENVLPGFPKTNGTVVFQIIPDGLNGWFVSGDFTNIGDSLRKGLAQVDNMFQVTAWNPDVTGQIYAMQLDSGILYMGGYIEEIQGQTRNNLGSVDATSGLVTPFAPVVNANVFKLVHHNNSVYFIGEFTSVNGGTTGSFAAVNATTGATIPENINIMQQYNLHQSDLLLHGDTLFVGGNLFYGTHQYIMAIELINNSVLNWDPLIDSTVTSLEWYNGELIATGSFYYPSPIVKINPASGVVTSVASPGYLIYDLFVSGDTLFVGVDKFAPGTALHAVNLVNNSIIEMDYPVGGRLYTINRNSTSLVVGGASFEAVYGEKRHQLASFETNFGTLTSWSAPVMNNYVRTIAANGNEIFVGGNFTMMGDSIRYGVAAIDRFTGNVTPWKYPLAGSSSVVSSLHADDNSVVAVGDFSYLTPGGLKQNLAILNRNTGNLQPWNISTNGNYGNFGLLDIDDHVLIYGDFDSIGGQYNPYLALIDPATGIVLPLNISVNSAVFEASMSNNILYLYGAYDTANGVARDRLCAFDLLNDTITSWKPFPEENNPNLSHINADNSHVFISGSVTDIGRKPRKNFVALDAITGRPTSLQPDPNGTVTCIAYTNEAIYLGGMFDTLFNSPAMRLACIDKNSGTLNPWNPGLLSMNGVNDLLIDAGKLFVGGTYGNISGEIRTGIASYDVPSNQLDSFSFPIWQHVYDLDKRNDTLYLAGHFNISPGMNRGLVSIDLATDTLTNLNDSVIAVESIFSCSVAGNKVIIGGEFDQISGQTRKHIAAFDLASGDLSPWDPFYSNFGIGSFTAVKSTAVYDSIIFAGGSYSFPGNTVNAPRYNFAAIGINSGLVTDWNPRIGTINSLKVSENRLFIGGSFLGNQNDFGRDNFVGLKLKPGPVISSVQDVIICENDTSAPVLIVLSDPIDVNSVVLEANSYDTSLVQSNNILVSGSGSNRYITVIFNAGVYGTCTIGIKAVSQSGINAYSYFNVTRSFVQLNISGTTNLCGIDTVTLTADPGFLNYLWNTGESTQQINVSLAGTYNVIATTYNGCQAMQSINVTVSQLPVVAIVAAGNINICAGDSIQLNATPGFAGYQWLQNNNNITGATAGSYYAKGTANYKCMVTDLNSCTNTSNNIRVRIVCIPPLPNQDKVIDPGINQDFEVVIQPNPSSGDFTLTTNCGSMQQLSVSIYDASWRLIQDGFSKSDGNIYSIEKLPAGIYYARIICGSVQRQVKLVQIE